MEALHLVMLNISAISLRHISLLNTTMIEIRTKVEQSSLPGVATSNFMIGPNADNLSVKVLEQVFAGKSRRTIFRVHCS